MFDSEVLANERLSTEQVTVGGVELQGNVLIRPLRAAVSGLSLLLVVALALQTGAGGGVGAGVGAGVRSSHIHDSRAIQSRVVEYSIAAYRQNENPDPEGAIDGVHVGFGIAAWQMFSRLGNLADAQLTAGERTICAWWFESGGVERASNLPPPLG